MNEVKFGIVGTGSIAGMVAGSIEGATNARLTAVSSRRLATAEAFVAGRPGAEPVEGVDDLLRREDVEAVYIATPTSAKERITLASIEARKHVLVDKPFDTYDSVERMIRAAASSGVVFMDATHFVHHPRTAVVRRDTEALVGAPKSLHTSFYVPIDDRSNIRFDPKQEPTGALGDLGWYSMRAIVEYLRPAGPVSRAAAHLERDETTRAVTRASGLVSFESGESSTFDVGYTAGALVMDLSLLGTRGAIGMDDFVRAWADSAGAQGRDVPAGFGHRTGMAARDAFRFVETPSDRPGDVRMIENLARLIRSPDASAQAAYAQASRLTQRYLDAIWDAEGA